MNQNLALFERQIAVRANPSAKVIVPNGSVTVINWLLGRPCAFWEGLLQSLSLWGVKEAEPFRTSTCSGQILNS